MLSILQSTSAKEMAYNAVILSIYIVILTILLRFLWNEVLVTHVTVLKRVDTLWHTFLLAVAVAMFRG